MLPWDHFRKALRLAGTHRHRYTHAYASYAHTYDTYAARRRGGAGGAARAEAHRALRQREDGEHLLVGPVA